MSIYTDSQYLTTQQYRDSTNIDARAEIHRRYSTNPYNWLHWVFDALMKLPAGARILEVGCGPAYLWKEGAERIPAGWDITLSDLSSGMLEAARRNLAMVDRNFTFKEIDAQTIPYEEKRFDAVIANHMLYHVPDRRKALAEIKRVLKPGGCFFATTVGDCHMKEMNDWERRVSLGGTYEPFSSPFTLENGLEQLKPFFSRVVMKRFPDDLNVREIEPILAYIRSVLHAVGWSEEEMAKVRRSLEAELKEKRMIFIRKDSGLFEAME